MDKTLQIVVVAAVIMMAAAIIMFLLTGKVGGIGDFVGNRTEGANCQIKKTQFTRACNCTPNSPNPPQGTSRSNEILNNAQSKNCGWADTGSCDTVC